MNDRDMMCKAEDKREQFGYPSTRSGLVGNHLTEPGVPEDQPWSYNQNNELQNGQQLRNGLLTDFGYMYDQNGNAIQLTLNGTVLFTYYYNAQDRLVQVDDANGAVIATYYYDPFGRRLWKEVADERTYFFYADEGLVTEYDDNGTELASYDYRPDSTWTTDPLWLKRNGEYYFYQNDHLGTPQKLVKQNGAVVWSARYTAFGQATLEVQEIMNNVRFPGQYADAETGLHYNWFRYYAPGIGRYLRRDPLGLAGGSNLYSYVLGNPTKYADPYGLLCYEKTVPLIKEDDDMQSENSPWHLYDAFFEGTTYDDQGNRRRILVCIWTRKETETLLFLERHGFAKIKVCEHESECGKITKRIERVIKVYWTDEEMKIVDMLKFCTTKIVRREHLMALHRGPQKNRADDLCINHPDAGPPLSS